MHFNIYENSASNDSIGTVSYADAAAVTDSAADRVATSADALEYTTSDYLTWNHGYIANWEPATIRVDAHPNKEEFDALAAKVKELEDTINRLWQSKAIGDLL